MAIREVDIFYPKECPSESETVFVDYKTVLRDELTFFCFIITADFSTTQITGATRKVTI